MSRRRPGDPVRWRVEAALLRTGIGVLRALPPTAAPALGSRLGRWTARLDVRHTERALANLRVVFPDWSEARRRALLERAFAELGRTTAEWALLPGWSREELAARVEWHGAEHVERALERGRGLLAVTAHFGTWEVIPVAARLRFPKHEITAVARALPNPHAQAVLSERRDRFGGHTLPQSASAVLRALRRNAAIGVLVDQYLSQRRGGILVPFMGRRTWTNPGPATLALRTGAALLPVHARRVPRGRYRIEFGCEFEPPRSGDRRDDIRALTRAINAWVEDLVRSQPELWLWGHRRWHHSPDAPNLYRPRRKRP